MYEGPSFSQRYECYCNQRQRRKKRMHRLAFEFLLLVSVIIAIVLLSDRLSVQGVGNTGKRDGGDYFRGYLGRPA